MFNLYLCLIFYIKIALPTLANKVDRLCIGWFQRILGFFLCIDGVLSFPVMRKHGYQDCTYTVYSVQHTADVEAIAHVWLASSAVQVSPCSPRCTAPSSPRSTSTSPPCPHCYRRRPCISSGAPPTLTCLAASRHRPVHPRHAPGPPSCTCHRCAAGAAACQTTSAPGSSTGSGKSNLPS